MSVVSGFDVNKFLGGSLVIAFRSITLTQRSAEVPLVLQGPGKIYLEEGRLKYEFYHEYKPSEFVQLMNLGFGDAAGKLVSPNTLFDFEGQDSRGNTWRAEMLNAYGDHTPSLGFFKGEIDVLISEETLGRPCPDAIHQIYFHHNRFPANPVLIEAGYEFMSSGRSIRINKDESGCDVLIEGQSVSNDLSNSMRKALNVIAGTQLELAFVEKVISQVKTWELHSKRPGLSGSALLQPVDFRYSRNHECFESFFNPLFALMSSERGKVFYATWHKLNSAWQGGIESAALNVSICIEGLLRHYFNEQGKDPAFLKLSKAAAPKVEALDVDERVKESMLKGLEHAGGFKAKTALYALIDKGCVSQELDKKWSLLRNKMAHAATLAESRDKLQELVDLTLASIKLFYELLFIIIDYSGARVDYAAHDFPTVDPSSTAPT